MATHPMINRLSIALMVLLLSAILSFAADGQSKPAVDRPVIKVKVPAMVRGSAESKDMNACFPGTADSPFRDAGNPGASAVKRATFGAIKPEEVRARSKEDVAALQSSCFGVVFQETPRIKRSDKSKAITFYGTSPNHNRTVKLAYYVENGELIRLSLWSASPISEAVMEQIFKMYVSGEITDAQWKSE